MPKETLSIVIITKNEEDKITHCLESIKWGDEIVVVDDLSTDRTVEICQKYGAKVIPHKSNGNFDQQRNIGIDNASSKWILQMDADEIVTEEVKGEIERVLADTQNRFVAFKIRRKNYFLGHFLRYGGWFIYYVKLFKKGKARYIGRSVHETLQVDGEIGTFDETIEHFPFSSMAQFVERQNFYTSVEAKLMYGEKRKSLEKEVKYNLTIRPLKLFWKSYIKKQGLRDGIYGLLFSLLNSWVHSLRWAKYWEICRNIENQS